MISYPNGLFIEAKKRTIKFSKEQKTNRFQSIRNRFNKNRLTVALVNFIAFEAKLELSLIIAKKIVFVLDCSSSQQKIKFKK